MSKLFQVVVHGLREKMFTIHLCNTEEQMQKMTVQQLKVKILEKEPGAETLLLIFADQMLEGDSSLLSSYGIQHMSHILLVMQVPGGLD